MTLTIGTNTYLSLADANQYFVDRSNSDWSGDTEANRESALIKAVDYLDNQYNFKGAISDYDQLLAWPRAGVTDNQGRIISTTEYPPQLKNAQCELALRALSEDLFKDVSPGGQVVKQKVGPLETEFNPYSPTQSTFQAVNRLLSGLVINTKFLKRT
ncbi:hypothetical protein KAR91_30730 [Candidatus Pacearchaeota archaeon]|nr:hypothetical protein [Candidatus Pacearchaeota archaeon]